MVDVTSKRSAAPVPSHDCARLLFKTREACICFGDIPQDNFLRILIGVAGIDGDDELLQALVVLVVFVLWLFESVKLGGVRIPLYLKVFSEAAQSYGFVRLHLLAEHHCNVQLRMSNKHDFLLDEPILQRTTSDVLICKISLNKSVELLDTCGVFCNAGLN